MITHVEAQDLIWFDQVEFEGVSYIVTRSEYDDHSEKVILWLTPSIGFGRDRVLALDPKFSFEKIEQPIEP